MNDWIDHLVDAAERDEFCVLVTVAGVRGSAPRETGAKMVVTSRDIAGTIGGGQLEFQCTKIAAGVIAAAEKHNAAFIRKIPLGANCGQCCGGVVEILFEPISRNALAWLRVLKEKTDARQPLLVVTSLQDCGQKILISADGDEYGSTADFSAGISLSTLQASLRHNAVASQEAGFLLDPVLAARMNIVVFGAGHVGAATVDVLSRLDASIRWIDSRRNIFAKCLPANVLALESAEPAAEAAALPANSYYLVMTHSHPLDLAICERILQRADFAYCGLIGSASKRRRFERLLQKQGIADEAMLRLTCPIGIAGIDGKQPTHIALAVAAEILQVQNRLENATSDDQPRDTVVRAI